MRYRTATGSTFTLSYTALDVWARAMRDKLIELGCSVEYAARVEDELANAVPVG